MITRLLSPVAGLVLASTLLVSTHAGAAIMTITGSRAAPVPGDPSVVSAHVVRIDAARLTGLSAGQRFELPRPDASPLTIVVETVSAGRVAERTIRGRIVEDARGDATFVVNNGVVSGVVNAYGAGSWRIRPAGEGYVLLEVDPSRLPGCGGAAVQADADAGAGALPRTARAAGNDLCEDGSRVDVLIFYTALARAGAGGQAAIENEILLGVDAANAAYANSAIGHEIRLVGLQEIDYDESTDYTGHLNRLTDPNDGYMDEAHTMRDELAADLVALIVADGEYCGVAWLMPANDTSSEDRGFSVTTWYCAANLVLAHELGHNMGACHAPGDGGGCSSGGVFEYSVGYRYFGTSGTQWRTVMAYAPGTRIPYFSNPSVQFDGRATGLSTNDNGRTLNETTLAIANYRNPSCPGNAYDDCAVDFQDILKLLANWGQPGGPSDVNGDGTVDVQDVLFVLQNWGPCVYE